MTTNVTPITDSESANRGRGMMKASRNIRTKLCSMSVLIAVVAVMLAISITPAMAGTPGTAITTCTDLQNISNDLAGDYYLTNDIDCSAFDFGDEKGFMPIGNSNSKFKGTFDGKGYKITNLYINRPSMDFVGLFGYIDSGSEIKDLGLEEVDVNGSSSVGGLVGGNYFGTITNCYSTGSVTGSSEYVGGLVGASVGAITNCYYPEDDIICTGCTNIEGNTTKANLQNETWFTTSQNNWDFTNIWAIEEGVTYPYLQWQHAAAKPPTITSFTPSTPVSNIAEATQTFNITIDQTVNVTWYINGTNFQDANTSVTAASYTNASAEIGVWNVSAVAENANGTDMQEWVWNVTAAPTTLPCTCGDICVNTSGWWRAGGVFNANTTMPIQAAVDAAAAGETICVAAGSYTENVNVNKRLTLRGEGASVVTVTVAATNDHVFNVSRDYVNISGFNVTGATGTDKAGIYLNNRQHCNISDNIASSNRCGIYLNSSSNNTLLNNTASSNNGGDGGFDGYGYGIYLSSSNDNTIYNNYFNNTNNAEDSGNNIWNTTITAGTNIIGGSYLGGNYWADYDGVDTTGDGLGDTLTPYNSSGNIANGGDDHPLTTPGFAAPNITSCAPKSPVNDTYCTWTKFNVTVDQTVNVIWYLDEASQHTNESVTEANYTFHADDIREHNVSAVAENANGTDMQTWVWNVRENTPPVITIDAPTQSIPVCIPGGGQFRVNFTYTELYPANYTVTVGNATAVINSTTNTSVAGGTGTANESFYLNASAADGWYNVTVEMYDNSSNYNITHQNNSVEKGSYDASISQPENQTTEPDVNATYELNITNTGNFTGTFTLAVTNHNGASVAALNETTITDLAVGASQNVTLNVTDASAGTYNVTVNVTSTNSGSEVAETGYIMTTVVGPSLTLGNVDNIASDWGRDFNLNHSVTVTNADASNVNVTYNVSWITGNNTMGTMLEDGIKWHNQTKLNSTVQNITVKVNATSTTGSATNDSEIFLLNITRRNMEITSQPKPAQTVDPDTTFHINASARDEYGDILIGTADLIKDGTIIKSQDISSGNVNFSRTEPLAGTFNFSIRFYNLTHYNNASTSNSSVTINGPTLAISNISDITSDWGRNFNLNHSVTVANATATNVKVIYNVSWLIECTLGTVNKGATEWGNQTASNSTVQRITVRVNANSTNTSAVNDTDTFQVNITKRDINITSSPPATKTVNPSKTFWLNATTQGEYAENFIGNATLVRDGIVVGTPKAVTDGNASFNQTESSTGTYTFSIRFYNLTYYFNASTDNSTVSVENPPQSSGGGSSGGVGTSDEPENVDETVVLRIYLQAGESSNYNFNNVVTSVEVTPTRTYGLVAAKTEVLFGQPASITSNPPAGEIYKYVDVFVGTSGWSKDKFSSSVINFQIPASWFEENNIDPASVTLCRHNNGEWQSLRTTLTGQAGGFYKYSSPTPGFSTFMILGQVEESSDVEPAAATDSGTVADPTPTPETTSDKGIPGFGILAGIMGILMAVYLRRK